MKIGVHLIRACEHSNPKFESKNQICKYGPFFWSLPYLIFIEMKPDISSQNDSPNLVLAMATHDNGIIVFLSTNQRQESGASHRVTIETGFYWQRQIFHHSYSFIVISNSCIIVRPFTFILLSKVSMERGLKIVQSRKIFMEWGMFFR